MRLSLVAGRMWGVTNGIEVANRLRGDGALSARIDYRGPLKCTVSAV
jgi:hypothetical protein